MPTPRMILVVDDEKNMRRTFAAILEREGYEVIQAATGEQAIELCSTHFFDVVLMDVRMPGIDGVEAFRRIREQQGNAKVILMSAYDVQELKRVALEEGAIAFLSKPLDVPQTIRLIGEVHDTTVLVVDSEGAEGAQIEEALGAVGYRVTLCRDPYEALTLVEQLRFEIVLIDVDLSGLNGLELYLAIKRLTPSTVAIMLSGREAKFDRLAQEAVRQTAYMVLHKPLDIDQLLSLLQQITGQQASGRLEKPPVTNAK